MPCLLAFLLMAFTLPAEPSRWVVQRGSTVAVKGKTNINSYGCGISSFEGCDTISMTPHPASPQSMLLNGCIYLDVARFDCINRMMTAELRKTLQADKHPKLKIKFITLGKIAVGTNRKEEDCGIVEMEIAGVKRRYPIQYCYTIGSDANTIVIAGQKTLCFSDFSLIPPRKLNGMVQAKDELEVQFHLVMRKI
ncbi:hypothetical protein BUE76_02610 [Cnuella takakiae]|nr:hypothetical protein BUE76_02610 [Cnuella takakiae]